LRPPRRFITERPAIVVLARRDAFSAEIHIVILCDLEIILRDRFNLPVVLAEPLEHDFLLPGHAGWLGCRA
jgi:hypothetical protein